jgi:hypothetical protein
VTRPKVKVQHLTDDMHQWLLNQPRGMLLMGYASLCQWCDHDWHAHTCKTCRCDSSRTRLDDTWRPRVGYQQSDQMRAICRDTGVDGWAVRYAVGIDRIGTRLPTPTKVKNCLYGRGVWS